MALKVGLDGSAFEEAGERTGLHAWHNGFGRRAVAAVNRSAPGGRVQDAAIAGAPSRGNRPRPAFVGRLTTNLELVWTRGIRLFN